MDMEPTFIGGFILGCITGGAFVMVISIGACLRLIIENRRLRETRGP